MTKPLDIFDAIYRFSIEDYYNLADTGILKEEDRVELIEGKIITMSPILSPHAACVGKLSDLIKEILGKNSLFVHKILLS